MKIWSVVIVVMLAVLLAPFATLWSLNTLFPVLNIPYSFDTWLAVVLLGGGLFSFKSN